ncbi:MAG: sigma factor-like helix-turn-helix DNA-binding protein [Sphingomonas sp.]
MDPRRRGDNENKCRSGSITKGSRGPRSLSVRDDPFPAWSYGGRATTQPAASRARVAWPLAMRPAPALRGGFPGAEAPVRRRRSARHCRTDFDRDRPIRTGAEFMRFLATLFRHTGLWLGIRRRASPLHIHPGARLRAACTRLPEPARSVYLLSARDGLSFVEIAVRLDMSVAVFERELATALYRLASDDIGVTSGPLDS